MADASEAVDPPTSEPETPAPQEDNQPEWISLARQHFGPWLRPGGRWCWLTTAASLVALGLTIFGFVLGWSLLLKTPGDLAFGVGSAVVLDVLFALLAPGQRRWRTAGVALLLVALDGFLLVELELWQPIHTAAIGSALGFIGVAISAATVAAVAGCNAVRSGPGGARRKGTLLVLGALVAGSSTVVLPGWQAGHALRIRWTSQATFQDAVVVLTTPSLVLQQDGYLLAVNPANGRTLWRQPIATGLAISATTPSGPAVLAPAANGWTLLDPLTGRTEVSVPAKGMILAGSSGATLLFADSNPKALGDGDANGSDAGSPVSVVAYSSITGRQLWRWSAPACPTGETSVWDPNGTTSAFAGGVVAVGYACATGTGDDQVYGWTNEVALIHPGQPGADHIISLLSAGQQNASATYRYALTGPGVFTVGSTFVAQYSYGHILREGINPTSGSIMWSTTTPREQPQYEGLPQYAVDGHQFLGWTGTGWGTLSADTGQVVTRYSSVDRTYWGYTVTDLVGTSLPLIVSDQRLATFDTRTGRVRVDRIPGYLGYDSFEGLLASLPNGDVLLQDGQDFDYRIAALG